MKFSWKIFIIAYCLFALAFGGGSFYMLDRIYRDDLEQVIALAEGDNKNLYLYAITLDSLSEQSYTNIERILKMSAKIMVNKKENQFVVGGKSKIEQVTGYDISIKKNSTNTNVAEQDGIMYVQVISRIQNVYLMNRYSLQEVFSKREQNFSLYKSAVIIVSACMAVILFIFSEYIARPIVKLKKMADRIADGDYSVQIDDSNRKMKSAEVKKLGEAMNFMAANTNETIEALEEMVRKREEFIGDFTHELKTPLTSIIGYGDMIRSFDLPADKRRQYGDYIYKEGKRLEAISMKLLQIIVVGNEEIEKRELSISTVLPQLQNNARFMEKKYKVSIEFYMEEGHVWADDSLFVTLILNLIDNGCKASEQGMKLVVQGGEINHRYEIKVIDQGTGIPEDKLDKILEPFYMVDKSRARRQNGAGLGLSLCKKIADLFDAALQIESSLGEGTTVTLTFEEKG